MILEKLVIGVALIMSFFMQTSMNFFSLNRIKPDFLLLLTIYFGLTRGSFSGLWIGFFGGLLLDINFGGLFVEEKNKIEYFIGTHALPKAILGFMVGKIAGNINRDNKFLLAGVIFFLSLGHGFFYLINLNLFHRGVQPEYDLFRVILESLYNAVISIFWIRLLHWLIPEPGGHRPLGKL